MKTMKDKSLLSNIIFFQPKLFVAVTSITAIVSSPLFAATPATTTLLVSATVIDTCIVAATPLAFADLNGSQATDDVTPSQITILCTSDKTGVTVTLNGGSQVDSGVRQMVNQTDATKRMSYDLFTNISRTNSVSAGGTISSADIDAATPSVIDIYGQVPAGSYAAGEYSDSVTVTVNY